MREVLHITTHMGGGVGKVLSGAASYAARTNAPYRHRILLLEQPQKMNFIDASRFFSNMAKNTTMTLQELEWHFTEWSLCQLMWAFWM